MTLRHTYLSLMANVVLLGYWVDKGGPDAAMRAFMETIEGKNVGVFCTLAYWADSAHAHNALAAGVAMVKDKNRVLGGYVCNGTMSQAMIARFRANGTVGPHSASPANEARWELMKITHRRRVALAARTLHRTSLLSANATETESGVSPYQYLNSGIKV